MPIITLEVMPDSMTETVPYDSFYPDAEPINLCDEDVKDPNQMDFHIDKTEGEEAGVHFLVDKSEPADNDINENCERASSTLNVRTDLLEYTTRSDGSVCCKICGKILASRTHWYRHKYRAHVMQPFSPASLFRCEQCLAFFKSRKGYIGHIASKHSETLQDVSPVLTNAQAEALAKEKSIIQPKVVQLEPVQQELVPTQEVADIEVKKEPDPEQAIPKSVVVKTANRSTETPHRKTTRSTRQATPRNVNVMEQPNTDNEEWRAKRSREEKLVADIIARVRRECEAQGNGGSARRGYSRKTGLHT